MQRRIVNTGRGKLQIIHRVVTAGSKVRRHISCSGVDWYGRGEIHLLPARSSFVGKGSGCERAAILRPEMTDVRPSVGTALVEADSTDESVHVRTEADTHFNGAGIDRINAGW